MKCPFRPGDALLELGGIVDIILFFVLLLFPFQAHSLFLVAMGAKTVTVNFPSTFDVYLTFNDHFNLFKRLIFSTGHFSWLPRGM